MSSAAAGVFAQKKSTKLPTTPNAVSIAMKVGKAVATLLCSMERESFVTNCKLPNLSTCLHLLELALSLEHGIESKLPPMFGNLHVFQSFGRRDGDLANVLIWRHLRHETSFHLRAYMEHYPKRTLFEEILLHGALNVRRSLRKLLARYGRS